MRSSKEVVGIVGAVAMIAVGSACDGTGGSSEPSVTTESVIATTDVAPPNPVAASSTSTSSATSVPVPESTQAPTTAATTTAATTTTTTSAVPTTTVAAPAVFRPYVADPGVCLPAAALETNISDYSEGLLRPFAVSGAGWHRFQIIADPQLGADGRWAFVGTIPANSSFDPDNWNAAESEFRHHDTINGWPVAITTSPSGFVDAAIDLGGDTDAYVRTYRFDLESIRALISGLAVRPPSEPIGLDYSPVADLAKLEMVIDRGDEPVDADIAVLECVIEGESIMRIGAITGDPLVQYVTILDQPYPSEIGRIGDAVVSISGLGHELGDRPRLSDLTHAPAAVWSSLLEQRLPSDGPVDSEG